MNELKQMKMLRESIIRIEENEDEASQSWYTVVDALRQDSHYETPRKKRNLIQSWIRGSKRHYGKGNTKFDAVYDELKDIALDSKTLEQKLAALLFKLNDDYEYQTADRI